MSDSDHPAPSPGNTPAEASPRRLLRPENRLDAWTAANWGDGLQIDRLAALEPIIVRTRNSTYSIVVLRPGTGEVLVRGGRFCPTFERAVLVGATAGGSMIKMRGIYPGLRIEMIVGGQRVLTSPVENIAPAPQAHPSSS